MVRWGFWPVLKHEKMYWEKKKKKTEIDNRRGQKKRLFCLLVQPSVHPQIFPSVLIALVNSWRLFICCRLMQPKSHYVWMDAVPFCRAARQIWVTSAGSWSFKINSGVSCQQSLDSFLIWQSFQLLWTTRTGQIHRQNAGKQHRRENHPHPLKK